MIRTAAGAEIKELLGPDFTKLQSIRDIVEIRNNFLQDVIKGKFAKRLAPSENTRLVITRKWSSWTPSFFDTIGGCYAFFLPKEANASGATKGSVVVVDPGFKFLEALRAHGVDMSDIDSIVVSHFHPDHMAGLMELLTLIQESDHTVNLYLNETTFSFFSQLGTRNAEFIELKEGNKIQLSSRTLSDKSVERFYLSPRKAFHREMGAHTNALSLIFTIEREESAKLYEEKIVILGDTDGLEDYFEEYVKAIAGANEVILHLGTVGRENYAKGYKHLYDTGMIKLLRRLKNEVEVLHSKDFERLRAIVISEFGLEMASSNYLRTVVALYAPATKWQALLLLVSLLQKKVEIGSSNDLKQEKEKKEREISFEIEVVAKIFVDLLRSDSMNQTSHSKFPTQQALLTYAAAFCLAIKHFPAAMNYWNEMQKRVLHLLDEYPKTDQTKEAVYAPSQYDLDQRLIVMTDEFVKAASEISSGIAATLFQVVEKERRHELSTVLLSLADMIKEFSFWQLRETSDSGQKALRAVTLYGRQEVKSVLQRIEELFGKPKEWELIQATLDNNTQLLLYGLLFSALLTKTVTSLKEKGFEDSGMPSILKTEDMEVFQEFLGILRTLAPKGTNILIGDTQFVASFDFEHDKYITRVRALDVHEEFCWEDIGTVKCKETREGDIQYFIGATP
jgi:hypothetical protein